MSNKIQGEGSAEQQRNKQDVSAAEGAGVPLRLRERLLDRTALIGSGAASAGQKDKVKSKLVFVPRASRCDAGSTPGLPHAALSSRSQCLQKALAEKIQLLRGVSASDRFTAASSIRGSDLQTFAPAMPNLGSVSYREGQPVQTIDSISSLADVASESGLNPIQVPLWKQADCSIDADQLLVDLIFSKPADENANNSWHLLQLPDILPSFLLPAREESAPTTSDSLAKNPRFNPFVQEDKPLESTVYVPSSLRELPESVVGKFVRRRSGKVEFVLDQHRMDVRLCNEPSFHQKLVAHLHKSSELFFLGDVKHKMAATPIVVDES